MVRELPEPNKRYPTLATEILYHGVLRAAYDASKS